jgi:hypothetical protein
MPATFGGLEMKRFRCLGLGCLGLGAALALFAGSAQATPIITQNNNALTLAQAIVGTGITIVGTPTFTGAPVQAGGFTNGGTDIGMPSGIVLSTGDVTQIPGLNGGENDLSTNFGLPGDAALSNIVGEETFDAAVLEFQFQFGDGSTGGDLFFSFVFASDEYLEFVDQFNDVFAFFVDGTNVALINGQPISINNINDEDNSQFYRDNPPGSGNVDIRFDGLTTVIQISVANLAAGVHTMRFAIADTLDEILDAAVFIGGGTFSTEPPPPPPAEVPLPAAFPLMLMGLAGFGFLRRRRKA